MLVELRHLDLPAGAGVPEDATGTAGQDPVFASAVAGRPVPLRDQVTAFKRVRIRAAVERNGGNWAAAARELGPQRGNLHNLARRLGLR
ncbi:MAG: hypothetical protein IPK64_17800 [bacterium]|nr:hypothetical protein [bacterium]